MRLRTRVLIASGAVAASLMSGLAIYGWTIPALTRLSADATLASRLTFGSEQLDALVHEYLIEGSPRARRQLDIHLADLASLSLSVSHSTASPLREAMLLEQRRAVRLLEEIELHRDGSSGIIQQVLSESKLRHLFEQAIMSSRELHDLTREWKVDVERKREDLVLTSGIAVGLILLATLAILGTGLAMVMRSVVRPVERLRQGVAAVADGDYAYRIPEPLPPHEVGMLVSDFNSMAERLQRSEVHRVRAAEREREAAIIARVNESLEHFAAHAAYDLQAPLRSITCFAELVQRRTGNRLEEPSREHIGRIIDSASRMSATIDGFLRFARAGEVDITTDATVDSAQAARDAADNLEQPIAEAKATVSIPSALPMVRCDHFQLVQVFQNLIGNAIKYRVNGQRVHIDVSATIEGRSAIITVQDDGPGIPLEHRTRIFGMFQRLHGLGTPGNGIGLALCHRIVTARGGRIWVDGAPGQGARFHFTLPCPD